MEVVSLMAIPLNAMYLTHSLTYFSSRYSDLVIIKYYKIHFFALFSLFLFSLKFLFSLFNARGSSAYCLFVNRAEYMAEKTAKRYQGKRVGRQESSRLFPIYNLFGSIPEEGNT